MTYGIAVLSVIPIRKEMSEASEMVSQLLFGESYLVLAEKDRWIRIRTCFDKYAGWISRNQHLALSEPEYRDLAQASRTIVPTRFAKAAIAGSDVVLMLGAGSELPGYDSTTGCMSIGETKLKISDLATEHMENVTDGLLKTAKNLLLTPYLWGGRSSFGCDCSGFVQTVFKIHHMALPRDASMQAGLGEIVPSLGEAMAGDLVFFTNGSRHVKHVGLLLSPEAIIHCSGCVRTDNIDFEGIFSQDVKAYTHTCYKIKRLLRLHS